jgi:flagellar motor protein MotB
MYLTKIYISLGLLLLNACGSGSYRNRELEVRLESEVVALQQSNRDLRKKVELCAIDGPPDALYASLFQVYGKSPIEITRKGRITQLIFPVGELFSVDGLTVREEMNLYLDVLATALNQNPSYTVRIDSHTDDNPVPYKIRRMYADNWNLAIGRSMRLMDTLVEEFQVDETRFILVSHGEFSPRSDNDTTSGQAHNNRIVVNLYPSGLQP